MKRNLNTFLFDCNTGLCCEITIHLRHTILNVSFVNILLELPAGQASRSFTTACHSITTTFFRLNGLLYLFFG